MLSDFQRADATSAGDRSRRRKPLSALKPLISRRTRAARSAWLRPQPSGASQSGAAAARSAFIPMSTFSAARTRMTMPKRYAGDRVCTGGQLRSEWGCDRIGATQSDSQQPSKPGMLPPTADGFAEPVVCPAVFLRSVARLEQLPDPPHGL